MWRASKYRRHLQSLVKSVSKCWRGDGPAREERRSSPQAAGGEPLAGMRAGGYQARPPLATAEFPAGAGAGEPGPSTAPGAGLEIALAVSGGSPLKSAPFRRRT